MTDRVVNPEADELAQYLRDTGRVGPQQLLAAALARERQNTPIDTERLWRAIEGIGVIENGTWVSFQRGDAEKIAAAYLDAVAEQESTDEQ